MSFFGPDLRSAVSVGVGGIPSLFSGQRRLWTPTVLGSALSLWLDAADASTITLNGSTVSQWNDKSGNGRHATQATAANQPAWGRGRNLLRYSEDFLWTNGAWVNSQISVTQNAAVAPDGTLTANKLVASSIGVCQIGQENIDVASGATVCATCRFKQAEKRYAYIQINGTGGTLNAGFVSIDLQTGEVGTYANLVGALVSPVATATQEKDGYWTLSLSSGLGAGNFRASIYIGVSDAQNSRNTTSSTGGVFAWGAQLNPGTTADPYQRTTSATQPVATGINGNPTLAWTGANGVFLDTAAWSLAPDRKYATVAVASSPTWGGGNRFGRIWVSRSGYQQGYIGQGEQAGSALAVGGTTLTTAVVTGVSGANVVSNSFGTSGLAANAFDISVNGGTPVALTGNTGALGTAGVRVGADLTVTAGGNTWDGQIGEIVIVSGDLSVTDRRRLEGYQAWKWGLEAKLPADHPYKNIPPFA